jgi:hypothetical protein
MTAHPFRDVAIIAAFNTAQARVLEGHTSFSITLEAALQLGTEPRWDIDG